MPKRKFKLIYPGYKYCGPGNDMNLGDPINELDAACQEHDKSYEGVPNAKLRRMNSDKKFMRKLKQYRDVDPLAADIMTGVFKAKEFGLDLYDALRVLYGKRRVTHPADINDARVKRLKRSNDVFSRDARKQTKNNRVSNQRSRNQRSRKTMARLSRKRGRTKRKRKIRRFKKKPVRRRIRTGKSRSYSRKPQRAPGLRKAMVRTIARTLNPPLIFESTQQGCARAALVTNNRLAFSLLFNPDRVIGNTTTGAYSLRASLGNTNIRVNYGSVNTQTNSGSGAGPAGPSGGALTQYGTVTPGTTAAFGRQFWILKNYSKYRVTNFTSGVLFYTYYVLQSKIFTNSDPINTMDDNTQEGLAETYPNTDPNFGGFDFTYGFQQSNNTFMKNKNCSIEEILPLMKAFRIVKRIQFKLMPNQNKTLYLKRRMEVFDIERYRTNLQIYEYKPGDLFPLIQVDSTITGSTTAAPAAPDWDWMSYGPINVPYETYTKTVFAYKVEGQRRQFQVIVREPGLNTTMTNTPAIIGEPVQQGGVVQNMVE